MKDVITITEPARKFIAKIFDINNNNVLVVGYDNKGCSGHKYTFYLCDNEDVPADVDFVNVDGGKVVVQPDSIMGLLGSTLALQVEDFGERLVWVNPSAINQCGCGDSFQLPGEKGCGQ